MRLVQLEPEGFRSLSGGQKIKFHGLTVLIGENDGGKSSTLDALRLLFSRSVPQASDYSNLGSTTVAESDQDESQSGSTLAPIVLTAHFYLSETERGALGSTVILRRGCIRLRKVFVPDLAPKTEVWSRAPKDESLRVQPSVMTVVQIRAFAGEHGVSLSKAANKSVLVDNLVSWIASQPTIEDWMPAGSDVLAMLPEYELVRSGSDPEGVVNGFLRLQYKAAIQSTEYSSVLTELESKLRDHLKSQTTSLEHIISKYAPTVQAVTVDPVFSFDGALQRTPLQLVGTNGYTIDLGMRGAGLKQRVTMAVYEWNSEVLAKRSGGAEARQLILALDEPDLHLDYKAQRELYEIVESFVSDTVQVIITTHSMNFINRVPITQINHYELLTTGSSQLTQMEIGEDPDEQEMFLSGIGNSMGLDNATMFYERAYLAFEGETERQALPILFKICHGTTMTARGIKPVNAHNGESAVVIAKFLNRNGRPVVFLVDADVTSVPHIKKKITKATLDKDAFPSDRYFFAEPECFEYAFSDDVWARVLNKHQFIQEGKNARMWTGDDIKKFRKGNKHFNKEIHKVLQDDSKPRIGRLLAEAVVDQNEIPQQILACLIEVDQLANPTV